MTVLLVGAGIRTLADGEPGDGTPPPRALLVDGDRIAWVGLPEDAPAATTTVDLGGAWIAPAFVDAHVHATDTGLASAGVDLAGCGSLAEALARLRVHAAGSTGVVLGTGWDDFSWPEGRPPTAAEVAAAAPGRTVLLVRVDKHSCVVDPATLAALPLATTEDVVRDAAGLPSGWLLEAAAGLAQRQVMRGVTAAELDAARLATCRRAAALGIGSVHEMGHPGLAGMDDARAWAAGAWPVEVLTWWADLDIAAAVEAGLRPGGDLFLDGSIGSHTAAVDPPYADSGGSGQLFHADEAVAEFFTAATAAGVGAGVHAIGGRAIEQAVAAIETAARIHGHAAVRGCRHRVEHVELPRPGHAARLAHLGVVASVQPAFDAAWGGRDGLYARRFGSAAALASNPFGPLTAAGVVLAFGSDSTVTPLDPWGSIAAAVGHRGGLGVDPWTALVAHTRGGRFVAGQDDVGVIASGWRADLAVWTTDPLADDAQGAAPGCLATVVTGAVAHGDLVALPQRA